MYAFMASLKPAIEGANPGWFSKDQLRFEPCMGRVNVAMLID